MGQLRFISISIVVMLMVIISTTSAVDTTKPGYSALDTAERELIRLWDEAKLDSLLVVYRPYTAVNPEHPITKFLNAALEQDGHIAAQGYKDLIDAGYPIITPRAMLRLSQYYLAIGDSSEASQLAQRLKSEYPDFRKPGYQSQLSWNIEYPYTLQLGAFQHLENAQKLMEKIADYGISGQIHSKFTNGHTLYVVCSGEYATQKAADQAGQRLAINHQLDYIVTTRSLNGNDN